MIAGWLPTEVAGLVQGSVAPEPLVSTVTRGQKPDRKFGSLRRKRIRRKRKEEEEEEE